MKIIPLTDEEFNNIETEIDIPKVMTEFDMDDISNGDVIISEFKKSASSSKDQCAWIYLTNEEAMKRVDEINIMLKAKRINLPAYNNIMKPINSGKNIMLAKSYQKFGLYARSTEDRDFKHRNGHFETTQLIFGKLLKFYGTLVKDVHLEDMPVLNDPKNEFGKYF